MGVGGPSGRTFTLYTKQKEPIVTTQVLWVRHYATYLWQIDDKASKRGQGYACKFNKTGNRTGHHRDRVPRLGKYKQLTLA
jgi:hypothetical protein